MTEQNTAQRSDLDPLDENDPLAELARIVAGEPEPASAGEVDASTGAQPIDVPSSDAAANDAFDIENELMKELGAVTELHTQEAANIDVAAAAEEQVAEAPKPFVSRATPVVPTDNATLEDQLMAELVASDTAEADMPQANGGAQADEEAINDALLEETINNAIHDVEVADAKLGTSVTDALSPFDQVDQAAEAVRQEAAQDVPSDDDLEDFFSKSFEDALGEEALEAEDEPQPEPIAEAGSDIDLEAEFGAAFEEELVGKDEFAPQPEAVAKQEELALENEFAKSFAEELGAGGQDEVLPEAEAVSAHAGTVGSAHEPILADEPAPEMAAPAYGEPASSGKGFKMAVGALGVALLLGMGVVGWGYYSGGGSNEPVVITSDSEPAKVKPENPGGEQIANQDNEVYNRVAGNETAEPKQEELISSRQQPVEVPQKAENRLSPQADNNTGGQNAPLGLSPKRVKTLTVKPDGTILPASKPAPATVNTAVAASDAQTLQAPASQASTDQTNAAQEQTAAARENDGSTVGIDGAVSTGALGVPAPSPLPAAQEMAKLAAQTPAPKPAAPKAAAPKPAAKPAASPAPATDTNAPTQIASLSNKQQPAAPAVTSSEWKIQVSSQRSRDAAEASFKNLQRRFSSILGGRSAVIQRADIDGKGTFYRAKVLANSKSEASRLCSRLKSAGGSCFVTR